ncbi:MAG: cyclic pyranopterin monophosphate synthase MoaC [Planctomycetes bacterium]|nr:cyclic pyranopterin monophosphate synthase MoaC [Planctomycetota bacterium]
MVDVGEKEPTRRRAVAEARIRASEEVLAMVRRDETPKGSVIAVARLAGILAAKRTDEWIPLAHPIPLDRVAVDIEVAGDRIRILATAEASAKTGVEMEALVAASAAALAIYDMGKSVDRAMVIEGIRLLEKSGGKSGDFRAAGSAPREAPPPGRIAAVATSPRRGIPKTPIPGARLIAGHGIEGDAHAGPGDRQVSVLALESIEAFRRGDAHVSPGDFGENITVEGMELAAIGIGTTIQAGEALLELARIGKTCHAPCAIGRRLGDCIMPREGLFFRVLRDGEVAPGDPIRIVDLVPRSAIQVAIIAASDRAASGEREDRTAPALAAHLRQRLGAHVAAILVLPDDEARIRDALIEIADRGDIDLILTAGGTGFAARDRTPEATLGAIERRASGLEEAMRRAGIGSTPHAVLSRGIAGIRGRTLIVNLPGSPQGAVESAEALVAALPHGIALLRGERPDP